MEISESFLRSKAPLKSEIDCPIAQDQQVNLLTVDYVSRNAMKSLADLWFGIKN